MATEWAKRVYLVIPSSIGTGVKRAIAQVFVVNGSGQGENQELAMFDRPPLISADGNPPATHYGFSTAAKEGMASALKSIVEDNGGHALIQPFDNVAVGFDAFLASHNLMQLAAEE